MFSLFLHRCARALGSESPDHSPFLRKAGLRLALRYVYYKTGVALCQYRKVDFEKVAVFVRANSSKSRTWRKATLSKRLCLG